jgi:ribosome-associated toxin RatA of RatAB toxin-antitoxin module
MKSPGRYLLLFLAFLSLSSFRHYIPQDSSDWVYEREKKGIKIFTKKGKWGRLRDSKAMMTVAATPEQMLRVLTDVDGYKTWMPRCKKSRLLARLNDNEFIMHLVFNAPWPVKNRDCVVRVKVEKDAKTGVILVTETSEPKYLKEDDDAVRIQQLISYWKLIPTDGGTEIINEYASNPGGNLPDWLTNTQSVDNPLATFENLQEKSVSSKK